jgi:hypothetical protein
MSYHTVQIKKRYAPNNTAKGMQHLNLILMFVHQKKISSDNTAIFCNITKLIILGYAVVVQYGRKSNFDLIRLKRVNCQLSCTCYFFSTASRHYVCTVLRVSRDYVEVACAECGSNREGGS